MTSKTRRVLLPAASLAATGLSGILIALQRRSELTQRLRGKTALITGASRGLGFALALELRRRGCHLVLVARNADELERAKSRLLAEEPAATDVLVAVADVSQPEEVRRAIEQANHRFGPIDIVINNAGIIFVGPVAGQTLDSFRQAMDVNFFGALHTTLAVLPQMLGRGQGSIVNIGSIGGKVAFPHLLPYTASKFALVGWSQGLRAELADKGIHVTTVVPGVMRTGSHIQARYTGKAEEEYRWFASAASFPATATSAAAAAQKIVKAVAANQAEVAIGLQAALASRVANASPALTAQALAIVNRFLPEWPEENAPDFWSPDQSHAGHSFRGSLPAPLEALGTRLIRRYNQTREAAGQS